jgi:hypothetical protein
VTLHQSARLSSSTPTRSNLQSGFLRGISWRWAVRLSAGKHSWQRDPDCRSSTEGNHEPCHFLKPFWNRWQRREIQISKAIRKK